MDSDELEKKIDSLLNFFGLQESAQASILTYSLGMKKKLGLAAAILHDPEILFLDEPTSGLDPLSSRNTRDLLKKLREKGITIFLTTHVLEMAEELCDRVGIIEKGNLIALGTPKMLRSAQNENLEDVFLRLTGNNEGEKK
jgi:ABC-2 type transport system ATP-binding protein